MTPSICSNTSTTPTTPSSTIPLNGRPLLNPNASAFTSKHIIIKSESGQEVDLERFKKQAPAVSSPIVPSSPARRPVSVRIETEEAKRKRLAEEEAAKRKEKEKDAEVNAKKAAEEKARRDEEMRKSEEAEAQKKREEEEQRKKLEEERLRKEEEEKERLRKEAEEKDRLAREAEEKARKEEEERKLKEEEERAAKEAEEKAKAAASAATKPEPSEEGEVAESLDAADEAAKEEAKDKVSDKAPLRIDTSLNSDGKRRPGRLDLSSTKNNAIPAPLPSALATARIIEDIGSIEYPEGILSPKPELNMNAKQGKFRFVPLWRRFVSHCLRY
ncbi:hypothetical protein TRAPUB_3457 [Trametes pubescens]|uniref:Eukaryotic translation initiation factor 4G1 eIF4E-binding domain-containing protein n=1 Tax=Trametes pubescens TaxID=154538 RepID=A0A1M2VDR4_TRAPU|nr:hypothetical protein TRAPUB_3457 [Trametes pubescens]